MLNSQSIAQESYQAEVKTFQKKMNEKFKNPKKSPLPDKKIKGFDGLDYFPIDKNYRIVAQFTRYEKPDIAQINTSTKRIANYYKYAKLTFTIKGKNHKLDVYQSIENYKSKANKRLFLLFTDLTNGNGSYAGGRYIDLAIPEDEEIIIDFNKSYNPYCAYSYNYSCPIPPAENHLDIHIKAGVKKP